jgi:hypothetical protein
LVAGDGSDKPPKRGRGEAASAGVEKKKSKKVRGKVFNPIAPWFIVIFFLPPHSPRLLQATKASKGRHKKVEKVRDTAAGIGSIHMAVNIATSGLVGCISLRTFASFLTVIARSLHYSF